MPCNDLNTIQEKFLDVGDLFGLEYNEGYVFCEVTGWSQSKFSPHTGVGQVAADSSSGFDRLQDPSGDDILYVEEAEQKVNHVGIGHSPDVIRRYTNFPESEHRLRKIPNLSTPTPGDDFGYVDGGDSPFNEPTDVEELFVPPGVHLDFAFYNNDDEQHRVVVNVMMRTYNIRPLDPNNNSDRNAISRIMSPGAPIPVMPVGSTDNQAGYGNLERYWGVSPVNERKARQL